MPKAQCNGIEIEYERLLPATGGESAPALVFIMGLGAQLVGWDDGFIEGFVRLMATPPDFPGPVNLGNPSEFTIRQLAEQVISLTGSRSQLVFRPLPPDDPTQRQPDIALAREKLGWQPQVALRDGLLKTIAYFDGLLRESAA